MSNYVGQRPILFAEPRTELTKRDIYKLSRNYDLALDNFFLEAPHYRVYACAHYTVVI